MNLFFLILCCFLMQSTVSYSYLDFSRKHDNELCPKGWLYRSNGCFLGVNLQLNFPDAVDFCQKLDSNLFQAKNQYKIDLMKSLFKTNEIITWVYNIKI